MNFYKKKLCLVRLRYDTFRKVLSDWSITWDEKTNRMIADEEAWRRIFRATPFARVYRYAGERRWCEMKEIFCGNDVTTSDATSSEDGGDCMEGETRTDSMRLQNEGEIEVIDLVTSSEDE
ncbi:UNVERIFIED_CONTAM: hypothetical protein Sindi_0712600 [Sesamum indicum]